MKQFLQWTRYSAMVIFASAMSMDVGTLKEGKGHKNAMKPSFGRSWSIVAQTGFDVAVNKDWFFEFRCKIY